MPMAMETPGVAERGGQVLALDLLGVVVGGEGAEEGDEDDQRELADDEEREGEPQVLQVAAGDGARGDHRDGHVVRAGGDARGDVAARQLCREAGLEQGADAEVAGDHHQREGDERGHADAEQVGADVDEVGAALEPALHRGGRHQEDAQHLPHLEHPPGGVALVEVLVDGGAEGALAEPQEEQQRDHRPEAEEGGVERRRRHAGDRTEGGRASQGRKFPCLPGRFRRKREAGWRWPGEQDASTSKARLPPGLRARSTGRSIGPRAAGWRSRCSAASPPRTRRASRARRASSRR